MGRGRGNEWVHGVRWLICIFAYFSSLLYLLRVEVVKTKEGGLGEGFRHVANLRLDRL